LSFKLALGEGLENDFLRPFETDGGTKKTEILEGVANVVWEETELIVPLSNLSARIIGVVRMTDDSYTRLD
jgi:hypothetical protein